MGEKNKMVKARSIESEMVARPTRESADKR